MRPWDTLAIVAMQIDRYAAERFAPVGDRAIEMRMRNGDRLQAAQRLNVVDRLAGDEGNAIPEHSAVRPRHQQRALPDRDARLDTDSGNSEIVAPDQPLTFRQFL